MGTTSSESAERSAGGTDDISHDQGPLIRRKTPGPRLHVEGWYPDKARASAVVALLHGYAEYGGRYAHVAQSWARRGVGVVAVDLRGHGRSEGRRGSCRRFDDYLDDVAELVEHLRERTHPLPAFLFGHSFGGLVAAAEGLASPSRWRAVILSSPAFGFAVKVPTLKKLAGRVASSVLPDFSLPAGVKGSDLTHDAAIARAYDEDPLVFKNASARWYTEALAAQDRVVAGAKSFSLPLYVAVGTRDRVTDVERSSDFFQAAGVADKTWDPCEGLFHEVLNEPQWPSIAARMGEWIAKHA